MRNEPQGRFEDLPPSTQKLVRLMQDINFGRIENLIIKGVEPVWDPGPIVIREFKCGKAKDPRPEASLTDFSLSAETVDLVETMKRLGQGVIRYIEVRHGLPFRVAIEG